MIKTINQKQIEDLKAFKQKLDETNISYIMSIILGEKLYYQTPLPDFDTVKYELNKLDDEYKSIIKFLSLGIPISKKEFIRFFSSTIIESLKQLNIVNYDEFDVWLNNLILVTYLNSYFFVGNPYYYPTSQSEQETPYIGPDSYWLSRILSNNIHGRVLDLCSGSGIQAVLAAKIAEKVVAVEIDNKAVNILNINIHLNDLEKKIELRQGDLFDVIKSEERFDYIISNPPFIPIPKDVEFPLAGNGGDMGINIIEKILNKSPKHLVNDGTIYLVGQVAFNKYGSFISNLVKENLNEFSTSIVYNGKFPIEIQADEFAYLAGKFAQKRFDSSKWKQIYIENQMEYYSNFALISKKSRYQLKEINICDFWDFELLPLFVGTWKKDSNLNKYVLSCDGKRNIAVDEDTMEFLKRADGKTKMSDIIESIPFKYKLTYGKNSKIKMMQKYGSLCAYLKNYNMIEGRRNS